MVRAKGLLLCPAPRGRILAPQGTGLVPPGPSAWSSLLLPCGKARRAGEAMSIKTCLCSWR